MRYSLLTSLLTPRSNPLINSLGNVKACRECSRLQVVDGKFFSISSRQRAAPYKRYTMPQSVKIDRPSDAPAAKRKRTAYIALGSNLGDRIAEIERACNEMDARGIRVKRTSSLWETEPMYVLDQNRFVNGACEVCVVVYYCCAVRSRLSDLNAGRDRSGASCAA